MSDISRAKLYSRLNPVAYKAIEGATVFCKLRGNPYVELVHWFHQLLQEEHTDVHAIIKAYGLEPGRMAREITQALDRLPRGASSIADLSSHVDEVVERAWVYATLVFDRLQVRTGHIVLAMLKSPQLSHLLLTISAEFKKVKTEDLLERFDAVCGESNEAHLEATAATTSSAAVPGEASQALAPAALGKEEALARFATDMTEQARQGEIDPVVGRDAETRQLIDVLMRRRQNNPMLTGEAGVGKTAVVEGLALRIANGEVPPPLREVRLLALDIGRLQAGASMKGEFENRLKQVIEEVQASPKPIILFVDEAHTLIGAGGAQGTGDAANLLKPALARGTLRTVAATTWAEYKKHIEKDPALTRRFQVVQVQEPSEDNALAMMRAVAATLQKHHKVDVLDEALEAAVKLSHRYIPARQLPDKAVSLLDTACARVSMSHHTAPPEVEDARWRIAALTTELEILAREGSVGVDVAERKERAEAALQEAEEALASLSSRWESERGVLEEILALRTRLLADTQAAEALASAEGGAADLDGALATLRELQASLAEIQGERPLLYPAVDAQAVASVVGDWTGIPVGKMVRNEVEAVLQLAPTVGKRVMGQDHALEMIARRVQTSRAGLEDPNKPRGVFLLAGPSGVGKTETALALAETLYGGEHNLITINMSEFQEAHTVSTLKGAPPGYVGYGEGGVLTEAVRRRPYSVVLLDEVEKAHADVHEIFFQVFDKGAMEDGEGRLIDFKNTLILLTSNVGSDLIMQMCQGQTSAPQPDVLAQALRRPLLDVFPAALLGRFVTIPYYPLTDDMLRSIVGLQLGRIERRLMDAHGVPLEVTPEVVELIVARCTEVESGGRMVDAILTNTVLPKLSHALLSRTLEGTALKRVEVGVDSGEFTYSFE